MIYRKEADRKKLTVKAMSVMSTDDSGNFRSCVLTALGRAQKCQALSPYGLCTNPPDDSMAVAFNMQGIAANTVAIIDDPNNRKKNLAKGEVALYNYTSESMVYLKEDGEINLENKEGSSVKMTSDGTITIDNASGSVVTLSAGGVVEITAATTNITSTTAVNITAPTITITGATALNLVSSTLISLTAPIINTTGLFTNVGILAATDFKTGTIDSINAHGHAPGTFADAEARPISGKSGVPS